MDTHTAVAGHVYRTYRAESGDVLPTVIASTASPYKFARAVGTAIDPSLDVLSDDALIDRLQELSGTPLPPAILDVRHGEIRHRDTCKQAGMEQIVRGYLNV